MAKLAQSTRAVCWGTLAQRSETSHRTICKFLDDMPKIGGLQQLKIFDVNLRQHFYNNSIIDASMKRCNILKINEEEIQTLSHLFELEKESDSSLCIRLMRRFDISILLLTCGEKGSYAISHDEISYIPTPKVNVVDTVGAGDSFTAAFAAALLNGDKLSRAHNHAVEVASYVCTKHGAMPPMPKDNE